MKPWFRNLLWTWMRVMVAVLSLGLGTGGSVICFAAFFFDSKLTALAALVHLGMLAGGTLAIVLALLGGRFAIEGRT